MALESFLPGDVVETTYGVGVITSCPSGDGSSAYRVLLWRTPGLSMASSSSAFLQPSAVSFHCRSRGGNGTYTDLRQNFVNHRSWTSSQSRQG